MKKTLKRLSCIDCKTPYTEFGLDLVIPDQQWEYICPGGGVLCPNCICKRAEKLGGTVILAWVDRIKKD